MKFNLTCTNCKSTFEGEYPTIPDLGSIFQCKSCHSERRINHIEINKQTIECFGVDNQYYDECEKKHGEGMSQDFTHYIGSNNSIKHRCK